MASKSPEISDTIRRRRRRSTEHLKEFLNDVAVAVIEISTEISPSKSSQIAHPVNEKLRIFDAVPVFELPKEPRRGLRAPTR